MKNKELIKHLQKFDPDYEIYVGSIKNSKHLNCLHPTNILVDNRKDFFKGIFIVNGGNTPTGIKYLRDCQIPINIELI